MPDSQPTDARYRPLSAQSECDPGTAGCLLACPRSLPSEGGTRSTYGKWDDAVHSSYEELSFLAVKAVALVALAFQRH